MKKVLIACEESQTECMAFRKLGVDAYSCDIKDCSGGYPQYHIKCDVREVLNDDWGLIIAHPPCTYLCKASAPNIKKDFTRYQKGLDAKDFFMIFYNYDKCPICVENPVPLRCFELPGYDQIIQPYDFGDNYSKKTCLWLKGLPPLFSTCINWDIDKNWYDNHSGKNHSTLRSKSSRYVAEAMAKQWLDYIK